MTSPTRAGTGAGNPANGNLAADGAADDDEAGRALTRSLPWRRLWADRAATGGMWLAVVLALVPLAFVIGYIAKQGLAHISWAMLTEPIPTSRHIGPGIGPAV